MDKSIYAAQMKDIIQLSIERIYKSNEVIEKEVRGHRILSLLLDVFITASNRHFEGNPTQFDKLALSLLPEKYKNSKDSLYERLLQICQFVSIQTDGKVVQLHDVLR
jgi:dGTPase